MEALMMCLESIDNVDIINYIIYTSSQNNGSIKYATLMHIVIVCSFRLNEMNTNFYLLVEKFHYPKSFMNSCKSAYIKSVYIVNCIVLLCLYVSLGIFLQQQLHNVAFLASNLQ